MAEYIGVVERAKKDAGIAEKGPNKGETYVKQSFKVNGSWFNCFQNDKNAAMLAAISEGDQVRIITKQNGQYENLVQIDKIPTPNAAPVAAPAATTAPVKAVTVTKVDSVNDAVAKLGDKDFRITYLACRRDALEMVHAMATLGMLELGKTKAQQADAFYSYVKRYALALAHDSWNVTQADAQELVLPEEAPKKSTKKELEE